MTKLFLFLLLLSTACFASSLTSSGVNCSSGSSGQVYTTNGTTCSFTTAAGTGNFSGPLSSTANDVVVFADSGGATGADSGILYTALATLTGSQTLTNKTLTNPTISPGFALVGSGNAGTQKFLNPASSGHFNFLLAAQQSTNNAFEITPSTATDGSTFSNPALLIFNTGVVNIPNLGGSGQVPVSVTNGGSLVVSNVTGTGNIVLSASPTLTGTASVASITASGDIKAGASGKCRLNPVEVDIGNTGTAQSVDLSTGNVFTATMTGNATFTLSNPTNACPYVFILTQDGTGSRTLTTAGVTAIFGNTGSKTLSTAGSSVDKISCVYDGAITSLLCDLGVKYQ